MPWIGVLWTDENERHLLEHGVVRDEAEYVLRNPDQIGKSRTSGRPIAFGYTMAGRYLAIVFERIDRMTVYPLTAYDVEE